MLALPRPPNDVHDGAVIVRPVVHRRGVAMPAAAAADAAAATANSGSVSGMELLLRAPRAIVTLPDALPSRALANRDDVCMESASNGAKVPELSMRSGIVNSGASADAKRSRYRFLDRSILSGEEVWEGKRRPRGRPFDPDIGLTESEFLCFFCHRVYGRSNKNDHARVQHGGRSLIDAEEVRNYINRVVMTLWL